MFILGNFQGLASENPLRISSEVPLEVPSQIKWSSLEKPAEISQEKSFQYLFGNFCELH